MDVEIARDLEQMFGCGGRRRAILAGRRPAERMRPAGAPVMRIIDNASSLLIKIDLFFIDSEFIDIVVKKKNNTTQRPITAIESSGLSSHTYDEIVNNIKVNGLINVT